MDKEEWDNELFECKMISLDTRGHVLLPLANLIIGWLLVYGGVAVCVHNYFRAYRSKFL